MERRKIKQGQVDDLVLLDTLSEQAIVANLQATSKADSIYTWIGPVLIAVNPFRWINGLYTPELIRKYRGRYAWELAPHVYAVAEKAYKDLMSSHKNQVILITGESGAGKTEAAKTVMEYVAAVSPQGDSSDVDCKDRLLQSNPVLEAFGNAKTLRNNNSSRFGKYMDLVFDYYGRPVGGRIINYLLEKPRVVAPGPNERSFHVFYFLLAGTEDVDTTTFSLLAPEQYKMLAMSGCTEVKGMSDDDEYTVLTHAMDLVGFSKDEQVDVFKLVSAILMLQNISFAAGVPAGKAAPTAEKGGSQTALAAAAALLGLDPAKLEAALTHRTIVSGANERICNPLESPEEANETARALAKAAYSRLFSRVIERINTAIKPPSGSELAMGVLDIYGFEIFELNSFEQLCINYCNEKLQQFFIALTLKAEQEEYAAEGIAWEAVEYFDNKLVCDLIEAKKPAGVLAYLDEESVMPQASDKTFYEKAAKNLSKHAHFAVPDAKDVALTKAVELSFTIKHYAGDVTYSAKGLLTKNRDDLFLDLIEAGGASRSPFIVSLFPESKERAGTRKRPPTASTQFRASMSDLVNKLVSCSPHYIRTIKPNDEKKAGVFTVDRVAHQVRYLGLLENVRVRRAGYAFRQPFDVFVTRYRLLCPLIWPKTPEGWSIDKAAGSILKLCDISSEAYKFGKTKLFIRKPLTLFTLEEMRSRKLQDIVAMLQSAWRKYLAKKYFREVRLQAQGIFEGKKRRRGSWALYFMGDYIRASESAELTRLLEKNNESRILFADVGEKVNRKKKAQDRAFVITEGAFYILTPGTFKPTNRIPLQNIEAIAMSKFADGYFVLRVSEGFKDVEADLVLHTVRKAEVLTILTKEMQEHLGRELKREFEDKITYRSKKGVGVLDNLMAGSGTEKRTVSFREDASMGKKVAVAELEDVAKMAPDDLCVRVSPQLGSLAAIQLDHKFEENKKAAGLAKGKKRTSRGMPSGGGKGGSAYGHKLNK